MNDHLLNLPNDVILKIVETLTEDTVSHLMIQVSQLRMVSKKFNSAINDEFICKYFMRTLIQSFSSVYLPEILANIIRRRDINAFRNIYATMMATDHEYASLMYITCFWKALRDADADFMREYLTLTSDIKSILSHNKILQVIEIANERDDKCAMILLMLPYLVSFIPEVDPIQVHTIKLSLMYGIKLTINEDLKSELTNILAAQKDGSNSEMEDRLDSSILLRLLEPKKPKMVVPQGRILGPTSESDLFVDNFRIPIRRNNKPDKQVITNFSMPNDNSYTVKYVNENGTRRTITFSRSNGNYEYEGLKTSNLYELFVRTSIFSQILGTFPHQHVAFTEETMKRPFEEQPWFFGALTDEEVEQITSNAAGQTTILMRSVGSNVFMHFSNTSEHKLTPHRFEHDQNFWHEFNTDSFRHLSYKFHTGFYNGGHVKDLPVFQFFKAVDRGDLNEIKHTFLAKRIDPTHPSFQHQSVLRAYLKRNTVANEEIVQWIVEKRFQAKIEYVFDIISRVDLIQILVRWRLVLKLLKNVGISLKTIEKCWNIIDLNNVGLLLITNYLDSVQENSTKYYKSHPHYFKSNHTRQTLVNLAWRYGNDDNYFKMLPGEIIEIICQFNLDPVPWEEIAEFLLQKTTKPIEFCTRMELRIEMLIRFGRFFCDHFTRFTDKTHANYLQALVIELPKANNRALLDVLELLKRYVPKMRSSGIGTGVGVDSDLSNLLHWCLTMGSHVTDISTEFNNIAMKKRTQSFELVKVLLDIEPLREFHMTMCSFTDYVRTDRLPCFWRAIEHKNTDAVEYLVSHNWMPLTPTSTTKLSASEYARICEHVDLCNIIDGQQ